nr:EOG090X02T5 [Lepidurus arcticus]
MVVLTVWRASAYRPRFFALLALIVAVLCKTQSASSSSSGHVFTNSFLVKLRGPLPNSHAHLLAQKYGFENLGPVLGSASEFHFLHRALPAARSKRSVGHIRLLKTDPTVATAIQQSGFRRVKRGYQPFRVENLIDQPLQETDPSDPYFPYQWYLKNTGQNGGKPRLDLNVEAAWAQGITGRNVTTAIMDDGIRMLDQPYMTDLIEANSMGHEPDLIDIYSASWGPTDDGKTVDGPRNATMRAIVRGVNEGRRSLGNIYVWASGDGGADDDCNCDGYAASMWTVSINSAINDGQNAHYDESCSSTLASTFSNGAKDPNTGVATTDLYGKCTKTHSGTSAAAPEAAGVFALALEANPLLTWRDIQHLTVLTSKRNSLYDAKSRFLWTMNGVGLEFNHLFGFGVLDAGAMVALAKVWKTVPPRFHCQAGTTNETRIISSNGSLILHLKTEACQNTESEVKYLEHVQAVVTLNASRRGDIEMFLTSPVGTKSMILSRRPNDDDSRDGFIKWPFMTTHTWGEYPRGIWTLEVTISEICMILETSKTIPNCPAPKMVPAQVRVRSPKLDLSVGSKANHAPYGFLREWTLMLHGTRSPPYTGLPAPDQHSKLAIVKKAHEERKSTE